MFYPQVELEDYSTLEANGSDSGTGTEPFRGTNGGGGIIQILASKGVISKLARILLEKGTVTEGGCTGKLSQYGYLKISGTKQFLSFKGL